MEGVGRDAWPVICNCSKQTNKQTNKQTRKQSNTSSIGPGAGLTAALDTRMSSLPNLDIVCREKKKTSLTKTVLLDIALNLAILLLVCFQLVPQQETSSSQLQYHEILGSCLLYILQQF